MLNNSRQLKEFIQSKFKVLADPKKAAPMAAYMKTNMPFYGIQKPERVPIYREMKRRFAPINQAEYEEGIITLWSLPYREEKYTALEFACQHLKFINSNSLKLYEKLIREGAWWDFVDVIAVFLVGRILLQDRMKIKPVMESWIQDKDFWIRRTAILSHNHHKKETDRDQLFSHCLLRAHETEFFIRKAIGWALREYSYSEPKLVKTFLLSNRHKLSPLSFREGAKVLVRNGIMKIN